MITALIGLYMRYYSGIQLFIIEIIGVFAAYVEEPFNYKEYGISLIIFSFEMFIVLIFTK